MTAAVTTIDRALREDFGFENIMFVYSGRRGIHCWVCDPRARALQNDARTAIVEYLSFYQGGQQAKKVNITSPIHPSAMRAFEILEPYFAKCVSFLFQCLFRRPERHFVLCRYLQEQDLLAFPEMAKIVLDLIPQEADEKDGPPEGKPCG